MGTPKSGVGLARSPGAAGPGSQAPGFGQGGMSGQGNTTEQLAELRRQHADVQARQEQAMAVSQRLMAEINTFRVSKEATKTAYTAAEEVAKTVWHS